MIVCKLCITVSYGFVQLRLRPEIKPGKKKPTIHVLPFITHMETHIWFSSRYKGYA